jgi:hypothetical protein
MRRLTDDYPGALRDQEAALDQYRELGDRLGEANALCESATVRQMTGDYALALRTRSRHSSCTATSATDSARPTP